MVSSIDRSDSRRGITERQQIHQTSYNKSHRGRPLERPFCYVSSSVCADDTAPPFCYAITWVYVVAEKDNRRFDSMLRSGDLIFHPRYGFGTITGLTRRDPLHPIQEVVTSEGGSD